MKEKMVTFEEKTYWEGNFIQKGIFVDGQHFDWGVDEENYKDAMEFVKKHPEYLNQVITSIEKHFIDSLSEFMGRPVKIEEVQEARKTGQIKK